MSVWAVLAAAGRGERLGSDRPKAFARLGGRPLLAESLERLESSDWIDQIVIAAAPDWEEPSILVAEEIAAKDPAVIRLAKQSLNGIDPVDVKRSYRYEQGFTFELNLAGAGDRARQAFVDGKQT